MRRLIAITSVLLLSAAHAQAADNSDDIFSLPLEALATLEVKIATGTPKPLSAAPAMATVITASELAAMGARDIGDALQAVPGLHVSNGSFNYGARYFIRGIVSTYNPHTLVLINGIPMTSLFAGDRGERAAGIYGMPIERLERIEIVRGPGSSVYGADAFAGVINLITRHPDAVSTTEVSLAGGSFATAHATVLHPFAVGGASALLSLSADRTDGDTPIIMADLQTAIDSAFGSSASLAPGAANLATRQYDASLDIAGKKWRLRAGWHQSNTGTGTGINDALDPGSEFVNHRGTADISWQSPAHWRHWDLDAQLSYYYSDFRNPRDIRLFPAGAFGGSFPDGVIGKPELFEENARVGSSALYTGWSQHRLRIGTGFYWGDIFETRDRNNYVFGGPVLVPRGGLVDVSDTADVFQPENQRTSHYVFVQDEWAFAADWEATYGIRYDHYSDVGDTANPRVALVWNTTSELTTKLLYGEAFRAPAFFELYATNNPVALGNPALKPEKLRSVEMGATWKPSRAWTADLNIYQLRIHDYIDFVSDPGGMTFTTQNTGRLRGRGLESEVRHQLNDNLQLLGNYSYQQTVDVRTGHALGIAPRDKLYLRANWDIRPGWQLTPQLTSVGERKRQSGDTRTALAGYTTLDLNLRYRLSRHIDLSLAARNMFDADIREASRGPGPGQVVPALPDDLPQPGRSVLLQASLRWP
ncbi:MAG: TonB-dependent receptor [Moraxellaceae bacterium]|nr:TonB-dependent receptor [Moraxellaceae bacterium]